MKLSRQIALWLVVFALGTAPFARCITHPFCACDDLNYVMAHAEMREGLSLNALKYAFSSYDHAIWMPFTRLSYALDSAIAGDGTREGEDRLAHVMHLHSVLLHGLNAVLLFWLLAMVSCSGSRFPVFAAVLVALIWAVHPLRVESVVWIASRKDVLSMAWLLGALIFWVKPSCFAMARTRSRAVLLTFG